MRATVGILSTAAALSLTIQAHPQPLTLDWSDGILTIRGDRLPGNVIEVLYLEAYCRANSQTTDWRRHTVVGHRTRLISRSDDGTRLELRCNVADGLTVDHVITSTHDVVDFRLVAHNPTSKRSETHWALPCIQVGRFAGAGADVTDDKYAYIRKSFVFLNGKLTTMPTPDWATEARYTPGQVWAAPGVPRADVNPRPLHPDVPTNGLIGCFSGDNRMILAAAFHPYQELFQGVIRCLHSDFRLGGLEPDRRLEIRGRIGSLPIVIATGSGSFRSSAALK